MILTKLRNVQEEISLVCSRLGIKPEAVTLVGVTKNTPAEMILEGVQAGLVHVAENKVQEAKNKYSILEQAPHPVKKHLIGHLQSNKAKDAVEIFDLIQSVDSIKLLKEIDKQAAKLNKVMDILIQVNVAGEEQKFGVDPESTDALIEAAAACAHVKVKGLMTIAPFTEDNEIIRSCFRGLKQMFGRYASEYAGQKNIKMDILSMGMTSDYVIALEEGANMLRVGRAIFH